MLRFQPDGWIEGLMRPLLLADPAAGIYFESGAPDWRFALFIVFMGAVLANRRARQLMTPVQASAALGTMLLTYVWTFAVGNGRYFIWGLLMIGPLLVMGARLMPGSRELRLGLLALVAALQMTTLWWSYIPNAWSLVSVDHNPVALDDSPLRHQPAVFLTVSSLSFSILVPRFHPDSHWASIDGQRKLAPGALEYPRLRKLLELPLQKYVVLPLDGRAIEPDGLPQGDLASLVNSSLVSHALALGPGGCSFLNSPLGRVTRDKRADGAPPQPGFWVCPVHLVPRGEVGAAAVPDRSSRYADVFARIEERCPRLFPPGGGRQAYAEDSVGLAYPMTDMRVYLYKNEDVYIKYFRAMSPTFIANVSDIRRGAFELPCSKPPGRYVPPWQRE